MTLLAGGVVFACGGQSAEHDANDGASNRGKGGANGGGAMPSGNGGTTSAGGSSTAEGGTAGVSSGGRAAGGDGGTSGLGGSAGVSGTGGGAGEPDFCFLEPKAGPCLAALRRYAYHSGPGICLPFTYTGCEGNQNNFQTVADCMAICVGDHPERSACATPLDCALMPMTCCGECTYPEVSNTVAVANAEIGNVNAGMGCIACLPCEPLGPNPWLVATCQSQRCVAIDARETGLTECAEDADCVLRGALGCCEDCQATRSSFVAVNRNSNLREVLCGNSAVGCDACVPTPPPDMAARCVGGRCVAAVRTVEP